MKSKNKALTSTLEETYDLFKTGKSIEEIICYRNYKRDTIERHIIELITKSFIDVRDVIDKNIFYEIKNFVENEKCYVLSEIKEKLDSNINWFEIKCTLAYFNSLPTKIE